MIKLVIIGGSSVHTKRYIQGILDTKKYEIYIITNCFMMEFNQLTQYTVDFSFLNFMAHKQIKGILNVIKAQIIHIHQANSIAWYSFRAINQIYPRPKVILTTWGSDILLLPKKNKLFKWMVTYNLRQADVITANSLYMAQIIEKLLLPQTRPVHTINFGIIQLPPMQNLAKKKKIILSNRAHNPLYRIDKIILAFADLMERKLIDPDFQLMVVGGGSLTKNLEELVEQLKMSDKIHVTGVLSYEQLIEYYQQATIFVSVPASDATALSLLEAMAYGCIPVISNIPSSLEAVIDKINGLVCANLVDLPQQLLEAIKLSNNFALYQQLYDLNHRIVRAKGTFEDNLKLFLDLYR